MTAAQETITAREIAALLDVTGRAVRKRAKKEKWPHITGASRIKLYMRSGLPPEIQKVQTRKPKTAIWRRSILWVVSLIIKILNKIKQKFESGGTK